MPPRSRPPVVLVAFAALIVLVFASSLLSSAPAPPARAPVSTPASTVEPAAETAPAARPVLVVEQEQDDLEPTWTPPSWSDRLAAAKHRAFDLAHNLFPSRPSLLSPSPSSPASPSTRPSLRLLGFHGDASLPDCPRTLLYRFQGTRGFASEYLRFVRAAAIAQRFGYEVFLADERDKWMYGSVADYFVPPSNRTCRLPPSAPTYPARRKMLPSRAEVLPPTGDDELGGLGGAEWDRTSPERYSAKGLERPSWTRVDHVADGYHISYTSALLLSRFPPASSPSPSSSTQSLRPLHAAELAAYPPSLPLDGAHTLPTALEPVFAAMSDVARRWWNLKEEIEGGVVRLGEVVERDEAGETGRTVGLHLRLGDKCLESANPKYSPLRFASDAQFAELKASGRVRNAGKADECGARATAGGEDPSGAEEGALWSEEAARVLAQAVGDAAGDTASPTVLAMSDDPRGVSELQRVWAAQGVLPGVEITDLAAVAARLEELDGAVADEEQALETGFDANAFHEAPLAQRIALTRPFLRDLTILARESEALIVSQASNVGRLLTLLAGDDLVRAGKVHSVDVRWFPTAYYA